MSRTTATEKTLDTDGCKLDIPPTLDAMIIDGNACLSSRLPASTLMIRIRSGVLLWLLTLLQPVAAGELSAAVIREKMSAYAPHASHPLPALTDEQLRRLLDGRVIKMRLPSEGEAPDGAMAMVISELSRVELWLGSMDAEHFGTDESLTIHHLPLQAGELFRWYGFVDLPAPVADRHFLIRTTINPSLPAASENTMWERSWALEPGFVDTMRPAVAAGEVAGLELKAYEAAVAVPVNFGAWIFIDLPDGRTLFGYHCATSLGGEIPDRLVTRYVFWGLEGLIARIIKSAQAMPTHYGAAHAPMTGGDGKPVARY